MNKFKIIISPSKTFNLSNPIDSTTPRPMHILRAKEVFGKIRPLSLEETKTTYNLSDKKANEVYTMHQEHGKELYFAIEMYYGQVFRELNLTEYDKEFLNEHLVILDALYGVVKPFDLIAPYRLDFKTKIDMDLKSFWKKEINEYFEGFDVVNLASKEFSSLIEKEMIELDVKSDIQIKKARGMALHNILINKKY